MEEQLIQEVKRHEVLYKRSSLAYRNKLKRADAWKSIAEKLKVPENICQTRWKTLRDQFVKKHAEAHQAFVSGAELLENPWQYYHQMEFLREYIKPRKTTISSPHPSLENEDASTEAKFSSQLNDDYYENLTQTTALDESCCMQMEQPSSSRKRSRRKSDGEAFKEFLTKMSKIAEKRFTVPSTPKENTAHEGFFSMVREVFQSLPNDVVSDAKFFFIDYLRQVVEANRNS